jgi:hypothetical protein
LTLFVFSQCQLVLRNQGFARTTLEVCSALQITSSGILFHFDPLLLRFYLPWKSAPANSLMESSIVWSYQITTHLQLRFEASEIYIFEATFFASTPNLSLLSFLKTHPRIFKRTSFYCPKIESKNYFQKVCKISG